MRAFSWTQLLASVLLLNLLAPRVEATDRLPRLNTFQPKLTTVSPAAVNAITLPSNLAQYGVVQTDFFRLTAQPGPIELAVTADAAAGGAHALLYDLATETILIDYFFDGRITESQTATITTAGEYGLILLDNQLLALQVRGEALVLDPVMPAIALPVAPYTVWNAPALVQAELKNPAETSAVELYIGDALIADDLLQPDGSIKSATVQTTGLPDGIYTLTLGAAAKSSNNASFIFRPILVDRAPAFTDVPFSHWAHVPIEVMFHTGVVNGREPGRFEPEASVLREEFAKMLAVTLGLEADPQTVNPFADVPNDYWARPYIMALYEAGLARGEAQDGRLYFHPERTITRAEVATIVGRVLGLDTGAYTTPSFTDWAQVQDWARPSVANLAELGWVNGFPDGSYRPEAELLRSQAAKVLVNFLGL